MTPHSETLDALGRAGRRVLYHLLRAGVEGLRALEAVIDELGSVGRDDASDDRQRVEIE